MGPATGIPGSNQRAAGRHDMNNEGCLDFDRMAGVVDRSTDDAWTDVSGPSLSMAPVSIVPVSIRLGIANGPGLT